MWHVRIVNINLFITLVAYFVIFTNFPKIVIFIAKNLQIVNERLKFVTLDKSRRTNVENREI